MKILTINSLCVKTTDGNRILDNIDLEVNSGDITIICGEPGSGKTILCKAIKGLLGEDFQISGDISCPAKIGMVFQNPAKQIVRRYVRSDVVFGLENLGVEDKEIKKRLNKYAKLLDAHHLLEREVSKLSLGEVTKVALLGVLVCEPEAIILDEPLAKLDSRNRSIILDLIDKLHLHKKTLIITEHDLSDLLPRGDKLILLKDGRKLAEGGPVQVASLLRKEGMKLPFLTELSLKLRDKAEEVEIFIPAIQP